MISETVWPIIVFLSTLSLRRATQSIQKAVNMPRFLSTLSLRRATRTGLTCGGGRIISIHALLAESDQSQTVTKWASSAFLSTLSLRRATLLTMFIFCSMIFLSTLSLRRATFRNSCRGFLISYFYPRSPCGERLSSFIIVYVKERNFYPRSPCGERRHPKMSDHPHNTNFYPRSPCGERPGTSESRYKRTSDFYPRSPCGERQPATSRNDKHDVFLSTLSLRRATSCFNPVSCQHLYFYPRSPCGERR